MNGWVSNCLYLYMYYVVLVCSKRNQIIDNGLARLSSKRCCATATGEETQFYRFSIQSETLLIWLKHNQNTEPSVGQGMLLIYSHSILVKYLPSRAQHRLLFFIWHINCRHCHTIRFFFIFNQKKQTTRMAFTKPRKDQLLQTNKMIFR